MKHIKQLIIDIDKKNNETIQSVQYDSNTRFIHISLISNSMPLDISGCSVKISGTKPDGTAIFNNCTIINAKEGFIEVELTEQINAVEGLVKCELKLYNGTGVLTTKQFNIYVTASVTSRTISSTNELRALTDALNKVQNIDNRFDELQEHCTGGNAMQEHSHVNKSVLDKLGEVDGNLTFNNTKIDFEIKDNSIHGEKILDNSIPINKLGPDVNAKIDLIKNKIENIISIGDYTQACIKATENNGIFQFLLKTDEFIKPIWHIGEGVFIDSTGAIIDDEINEKLIYNFKYKVKLTADNETIYVPVDTTGSYDMYIDWGDGSEDTHFKGIGYLKSCSHTYTGNVGDIFTITLYGDTIPKLDFGILSRGGQQTLFSVENNTLKNGIYLSFNSCPNLTKIAKNTFRNYTGTSINFTDCTSLSLIEDGFSKYINKSNITSVSFSKTQINYIDDDFFDGMILTSLNALFRGTKITSIPSSLPKALINCNNFYYAFYGLTEEVKIPNDLFDYVNVDITDVRNCFNGGSAANIAPLVGDAKILYDTLLDKMSGTNYSGCFSNNSLSNRDQVPTAWGGSM